jgi:hypothetical protein
VIAAIKGVRRRKAFRATFDAESLPHPERRRPAPARASAPLVHGRGLPTGPAAQTRILYRIVDEHDGDALAAKLTRSSRRALALGERIAFFRWAWSQQEVLEGNERDRDGAQDFTRPSSEVYPQFEAGIEGWCAEREEGVVGSAHVRERRDTVDELYCPAAAGPALHLYGEIYQETRLSLARPRNRIASLQIVSPDGMRAS